MFFLSNHKGQPLWWVHLPDGCSLSAASNQILHHWVGASHTLSKILLSGGIKKKTNLFCSIPRKCTLGVLKDRIQNQQESIRRKQSKTEDSTLSWAMCFVLSLWRWNKGKERNWFFQLVWAERQERAGRGHGELVKDKWRGMRGEQRNGDNERYLQGPQSAKLTNIILQIITFLA